MGTGALDTNQGASRSLDAMFVAHMDRLPLATGPHQTRRFKSLSAVYVASGNNLNIQTINRRLWF
jgi:hypothetical protein